MFKNATVSVMKNESKEGIVNYYYDELSNENYGIISRARNLCKRIQYRLADIGLVSIVDQEYVVK